MFLGQSVYLIYTIIHMYRRYISSQPCMVQHSVMHGVMGLGGRSMV